MLILISLLNLIYLIPLSDEAKFIGILITQCLQLSALCFIYNSNKTYKMFHIFICYFVSRLILFFSTPWLEDDYFRYIWDAKVLGAGINPYLFAPADQFLDFINFEFRDKINFSHVRTIYPPLAQFYFSFMGLMGDTVLTLRAGAVGLELLCAFFIYKAAKYLKINQLMAIILFLFFPTVMKENINSVHFDLLAVLFMFMAYFLTYFKDSYLFFWLRWVFLAAAIATKIYPILFVPCFWKHEKRKLLSIGILCSTLILLYLPFYEAKSLLFSGTGAFARDWEFFPSFYYFVSHFFNYLNFTNFSKFGILISFSKLVSVFILGLVIVILFFKKSIKLADEILIIFFTLFITSPVLNTWYWLWCLPWVLLIAPRWSLSLPVFTALGYSWFVSEGLYQTVHWPIYGLAFIFLIYQVLSKSQTSNYKIN